MDFLSILKIISAVIVGTAATLGSAGILSPAAATLISSIAVSVGIFAGTNDHKTANQSRINQNK
jgi:ABC-type antimicrobial peptide transport system permease subunit